MRGGGHVATPKDLGAKALGCRKGRRGLLRVDGGRQREFGHLGGEHVLAQQLLGRDVASELMEVLGFGTWRS